MQPIKALAEADAKVGASARAGFGVGFDSILAGAGGAGLNAATPFALGTLAGAAKVWRYVFSNADGGAEGDRSQPGIDTGCRTEQGGR